MSKVDCSIGNDFCPQTLFLYGTYGDDGKPDFGLFCWFSYTWDSQLGVMACIGGEKLTKDRILKNKVFSANLVTEEMLPLADYLGSKSGYDADKMDIDIAIERGHMLDVPVLSDSPVVFELEAQRFIELDGGTVMLCKIHNVLQEENLDDPDLTLNEKMRRIAPVSYTVDDYFAWDGHHIGTSGDEFGK